MSEFIVLKNRKLFGVFQGAADARQAVLDDIDKTPRAVYEVGRLIRRLRTERTPPRYDVVEEDLN